MNIETMHKHHRLIWAGAVAGEFTDAQGKQRYAKELGFNYRMGCSACAFVGEDWGKKEKCSDKCPLVWSNGFCEHSEYGEWRDNPTQAKALAILNVPLRHIGLEMRGPEEKHKCCTEPEKPKLRLPLRWNYPCHGKSNHGRVVYFTAPSTGTLVEYPDNPKNVGFKSDTWAMCYFTPCAKPVKYPWYGRAVSEGTIFCVAAKGARPVCVKTSNIDAWFLGESRGCGETDSDLTPCDPPKEETYAVGDTVMVEGNKYLIKQLYHPFGVQLLRVDNGTSHGGELFEPEKYYRIKCSEIPTGHSITKLKGHWEFIEEGKNFEIWDGDDA